MHSLQGKFIKNVRLIKLTALLARLSTKQKIFKIVFSCSNFQQASNIYFAYSFLFPFQKLICKRSSWDAENFSSKTKSEFHWQMTSKIFSDFILCKQLKCIFFISVFRTIKTTINSILFWNSLFTLGRNFECQ